MSILKPLPLSREHLSDTELAEEKKLWKRYGPCAVGEKALFLNSRFLERRFYIPVKAISRVYKRIAMSRGGFTGKGVFGSIPYLVVEFDGDRSEQFTFKYEEQVDLMLDHIAKQHPSLKRMSAAAEKKWLEKQRLLEEKKRQIANAKHRGLIDELEAAKATLAEQPELATELSAAARAKRAFDRSRPAYKWVALAIVIAGVVAAAFGAYTLLTRTGDFGVYFLLFGLAAIFLFSGGNVLPTARNNRTFVEKRLTAAQQAMEDRLKSLSFFPVPPRYAHPGVLDRMIRVLAEERADTIPSALDTVKADLKSIDSSVTVEQEEYEEIVAIKPLFLINDYR